MPVTSETGNTVAVVAARQRWQLFAAAEQHAAETEQHDGHQDEDDQVQQNQGHVIDFA